MIRFESLMNYNTHTKPLLGRIRAVATALALGMLAIPSVMQAEVADTTYVSRKPIDTRLTRGVRSSMDSTGLGFSNPDTVIPNMSGRKVIIDSVKGLQQDYQFRAQQYAFLKPATINNLYPGKRFMDHAFLTFGAGPTWMQRDPAMLTAAGTGVRLEAAIGDWLGPIHGLRLSMAVGTHSSTHKPNPHYLGFGLDYLINLTSLANAGREPGAFEAIGVAGVEAGYNSNDHIHGGSFGGHLGLQLRWNFQPETYLFIEPRANIYSGRYVAGYLNWAHFNLEAQLMAGIGFRFLDHVKRQEYGLSYFDYDRRDGNLFFGLGGSATNYIYRTGHSDFFRDIRGGFQAFAGYWFTPVSGIRLNANYGQFPLHKHQPARRRLTTVGIDYVLNLTSLFGGYRTSELLEVDLNIGAGGAQIAHAGIPNRIYPFFESSLQMLFRVNPNWGIYFEPQMRIFNRRFYKDTSGDYIMRPGNTEINFLTSLNVGVRYTLSAPTFDYADSWRTFRNEEKKGFIDLAGGFVRPNFSVYGTKGCAFSLGFGSWLSPVSGWRVMADFEHFNVSKRYYSLAVAADYLVNISNAAAGSNPHRVCTVIGALGIYGGAANFSPKWIGRMVAGAKVGLQARFRLTDFMDLFLEPQGLFIKAPTLKNRQFTSQLRVMAGVSYRFGENPSDRTPFYRSNRGELSNFASVAAGPSIFSLSINRNSFRVGGGVDVHAGRWFSSVSAVRAGVSYDFSGHRLRKTNIGSFHVDYMFDVTNMFEPSETRPFSFIGIVGTGFGWSNTSSRPIAWMAQGGLQFRYRVTPRIDAYCEPTIALWQRRVYTPDFYAYNKHSFVGVGRILFGASYRF